MSASSVAEAFVTLRPDLSKFQGEATSKMSGTLKKVAAAAVGVIGVAKAFDFLSSSIRDAADENQGIEVLANTMKKTVGASDEQTAAVERWITKMQNATGVMDDELRPAMGKLLIAGRSVSQAERDLGVAADIAAARHIPLETVVTAMAKAAQGNAGALGRMGIATKDAAGNALGFDEILKKASETMGGAAATAADTAAGRAAILQAKFADLKENVGNALIPIMETLVSALMKVTDWFNNLSPGMQKVVLIGGALLVAIGPLVGLIGSISTAVGLLSKALLLLAANPIVLVIAAVAALVIGLVIAYQKVGWFRDFVNAAFNTVKTVAVDVFHAVQTAIMTPFNWLKDHWPLVLAILTGPFGLAVLAIAQHFDSIVNFVTGMPGRITAAARGMWDGIKNAFRSAINWIIRAWNGLEFKIPGFDPPGPGPKFGGFTLGVPNIPLLHQGGQFFAAGGEGLALLRNREVVTTPEDMGDILAELRGLREEMRRNTDNRTLLARAG